MRQLLVPARALRFPTTESASKEPRSQEENDGFEDGLVEHDTDESLLVGGHR